MQEYTKHWLHFRPNAQLGNDVKKIGDTTTEVSVLNSHGGQSSLEIRIMLLTLWCLNGATRVTDEDYIRIPHKGNPWEEVLPAVEKMVLRSSDILEWSQLLKSIKLDKADVLRLQQAAIAARLGTDLHHSQIINGEFRVLEETDETGEKKRIAQTYPVVDFVTPRHVEQKQQEHNTVWWQTQVMEENMRLGGQEGVSIHEDGTQRKTKLRAVNSIDGQRGLQNIMAQLSEFYVGVKTGMPDVSVSV
jgi:hypothetical protein